MTPADAIDLDEYDDDVERTELAAMRLRRDARRGRRNGAADVKASQDATVSKGTARYLARLGWKGRVK